MRYFVFGFLSFLFLIGFFLDGVGFGDRFSGGFGAGERRGFGADDFQETGTMSIWSRTPSMSRTYRPYYNPYRYYPYTDEVPRTEEQVDQFLQRGRPGLRDRSLELKDALEPRSKIGSVVRKEVGDTFPYLDQYPFETSWWRRPSWYGVAQWLEDPIDDVPLYYDRGYGYPQDIDPEVSYEDNVYDEETALAASGNWIPLGIFAWTRETQDPVTPNMFMQLSLSKSGAITGTLYVRSYNQTYPLSGRVDRTTQLAVWKMSESPNSPYLETGLYNLTQDETPVRVVYADGRVGYSMLVRINRPLNVPLE